MSKEDHDLFQRMIKRLEGLPTESLEYSKFLSEPESVQTTGKVLNGEELTIEVSKVILKYRTIR